MAAMVESQALTFGILFDCIVLAVCIKFTESGTPPNTCAGVSVLQRLSRTSSSTLPGPGKAIEKLYGIWQIVNHKDPYIFLNNIKSHNN